MRFYRHSVDRVVSDVIGLMTGDPDGSSMRDPSPESDRASECAADRTASALADADPDVASIVGEERRRQESTLSLIASENCASRAVMAAQGSCLTNKYAEGEPGDRYYAGCEHVDDLERLATRRAEELFDVAHANVQPHAGTQANVAAYEALLEPGDRICSLGIGDGGHLSHGHPATLVGSHYDVATYDVDPETGYLDYDAVEATVRDTDPDLVVAGYSAYPRTVDWERFREIADAVDAWLLADIAHLTGLIAADEYPSPVGVADVVTGSTHKTIRAGRGGIVMTDDDSLADDLDAAVFPGVQGGPLVHNMAGKAVGFGEALRGEFEGYAERVLDTADALAERLQKRGYALVSEGTDCHFALVDLRPTDPDLPGTAAEDALERAGLVVSRSAVPGDERPTHVGSGIRLGTPALVSRGLGVPEVRQVADWIADVLDAPENEAVIAGTRAKVRECCLEHPIYDDGWTPATSAASVEGPSDGLDDAPEADR
ncbi:serine hydroxymethyltransferase [Salinarchaeum sp. Harcht-Bsk1]|uniref:serine hydroxymethyltransferase n=1 Tax=Salinarchaeum sp. Harcht-Bsk1 TaxID=1333523 RepID=UPI00034231A7|nr:serine hydroxymethyltransferase [Salinarchaeum sp. Harcht-Bsk1]AGN01437.1 serine hydroxymethyltransferase [Salinarchaeum sp. Harcht-Bsk1]